MLEIVIADQKTPEQDKALEEFKAIATQEFIEKLADELFIFECATDAIDEKLIRLGELSQVFGGSTMFDVKLDNDINLIVHAAIKLRDAEFLTMLADYHASPEQAQNDPNPDFVAKLQAHAKKQTRPALRVVG